MSANGGRHFKQAGESSHSGDSWTGPAPDMQKPQAGSGFASIPSAPSQPVSPSETAQFMAAAGVGQAQSRHAQQRPHAAQPHVPQVHQPAAQPSPRSARPPMSNRPGDTAQTHAVNGVRPVQPGHAGARSRSVAPAHQQNASNPYGAPRPQASRSNGVDRYHDGGPNGQPPKKKRGANIVSTLLIVVGVALLLVAGGMFLKAQMGYKEASEHYASIEQAAVSDRAGDGVPVIDWDALAKESDQIVGWIYVPGTRINYPVAKGRDNQQFLRHLPNGQYNANGTIFMDMDGTAPGVVDQQTTLYGHHMNDGSMFQIIDATRNQADFDKIDKVYYLTPETTYVFKPMFTAQVQDNYLDVRRTNFDSQEDFKAYLQNMLSQARAQAPNANDRIKDSEHVLTLVTCAGEIIPRTTRATMVCSLEDTMPTKH